MPSLKNRAPKYSKFRKGARVSIDGKYHYLPGEYGSDESLAAYRGLIATWKATSNTAAEDETTIAELLAAYLDYAKQYYGDLPRGRYRNLLPIIRVVNQTYGSLPAREFTPKRLKAIRQIFIDNGNSRSYCNRNVQSIVAIFAWGAEEELIDGNQVASLREVRGLRKGRSEARESEPVTVVESATVDATLPFLSDVVADMCRLQLLCGCRPGELCNLTPGQVDRSGDVWLYQLAEHKTAHHGHQRTVCIGPQAQDVLRRYLVRADDAPCFSPREAYQQHLDRKQEARKTPLSCGNRPSETKRRKAIAKLSDRYDVNTYRKAIHRACDKAGVERWSPNRLRHSAATLARSQFGLDGAQSMLGHRHARVTEIYAEKNLETAVLIAAKIG